MRVTELSGRHKFISVVLTVSVSLAGLSAVQSAEDASKGQINSEGGKVDTANSWDADTLVRNMMSEWKKSDPVASELLARGDVSIVSGVELAALRTDDKRWGKSRSLAYTKAFAEAINEYVSRTRKNVTTEFLQERFEQDLDESEFVYRAGESEDELISRVFTKAAVLGERKLDSALVESGMSQEEIDRLTPPQKKVAFFDRLTRRVTTSTAGSAAGLVPIKTFEAYDDEGNSAIGVVAVRSFRMKHLAEKIAAHKTIQPEAERARIPIPEQVAELSDEDLVYEFGPRVWWDEHGYPTVVSFGQWAWSPEGLTKRKMARRRSFALDQASNDAIGHLTMFVNASTRFTEVSEQGDENEEFSYIWSDGTVSDQDTARITDRLRKFAKVNSTADFTGIKVQREWFTPHPSQDGHELVGVIVSWSPAQEDQVRAELGKKPKHQVYEKKSVQKSDASTGTAKSRNLMDPADF